MDDGAIIFLFEIQSNDYKKWLVLHMKKHKTEGKVTLFTNLMYAAGDFPFSFSVTLIGFFLMIYLTNSIGINAFWAGAIIFISIVWDAITDPVVGYINDNTRSRLGRRRKYIFMFLLPMAISFLMLFSVPSLFRESSQFLKVLVTLTLYLLFKTFMTLVATPYGAIINEITDDYDERTKMTTFRMTSSIIGTLLAIVIPEFLGLSNATQSNTVGYIMMGVIFAGLMTFLGYASVFSLRERNRHLNQTKHKFDFKKYFVHSWKSAPFRQVTIMYMLSISVMNFIQGNLVYFINYKMLLPGIFLPIAGGVMVLAILFMPLWALFSKWTSKRTAYIVAILIIVTSLVSLYFVPAFDFSAAGVQIQTATDHMLLPQYQGLQVQYIQDVNTDYGQVIRVLWHEAPWVYASILFLSLGFSGLQMLPFTMVPDAINFSANAKEKKEGAYYGIVTFVQKMGWGFGMLITGIILNAAGYLEPAKVFTAASQNNDLAGMIVLQQPSAIIAITVLFSLIPALLGILGIVSIWKYKIDRDALHKQMEMINAEDETFELEIREVNSAIEVENFIRLHEVLYQDDPYHVLPIRKEFKEKLTRQLLDKASLRPVIAYNVYVNGRISGRIWLTLWLIRPGKPGEKMQGVFDFFECVDDYRVAEALFDKAEAWFMSQDVDYFYGNTDPDNPDEGKGVLVDGFDSTPAIMCAYNKPYYGSFFEKYGFGVREELWSYRLTLDDVPYDRYEIVDKLKERYGFYIRSVEKKHLDRDAKDVLRIMEESISDDWDFRAPDPDKLYEMLKEWRHFLDLDLVKIAYTNEGRPIAFSMMVPNFNEALQKIKGHWNPIAILRLFYYKNKIKTTRAMIQMVIQDYQNKGIINALYEDYFKILRERGIQMVDASAIGSDNYKSRYAIEKLGGEKYKVFNVYGIEVPKANRSS